MLLVRHLFGHLRLDLHWNGDRSIWFHQSVWRLLPRSVAIRATGSLCWDAPVYARCKAGGRLLYANVWVLGPSVARLRLSNNNPDQIDTKGWTRMTNLLKSVQIFSELISKKKNQQGAIHHAFYPSQRTSQ